MTELYLIRHAHATWTPDQDESRPLSDRGRLDAARIADLLSPLPFDAIYSSPSARAVQTVEPLSQRVALPIQERADLRERELMAGAAADFEAAVRDTWADFDHVHPGGESNASAQQRGVAICLQIADAHPAGRVAAATHGTLLTLILNRFDPAIGFDFWSRMTMPDVYVCAIEGGGGAAIRRMWDQ
jgi:2,3-bisphosphoglycerate-dependent phosphoglycerate mutase